MAAVEVSPLEFHFVSYDAEAITAIIAGVADDAGLPAGTRIQVDINEATPLGRATLTDGDPIVLTIEGGAFEDPTNPRNLSERLVRDVVGRMLMRAADRRTAGFADAPDEQDLTLPQLTAWDSYSMGRLERRGYDVRKARRLYHFRNRHGFNDVADAVFARLWSSDSLTWADLTAGCAETEAFAQPA